MARPKKQTVDYFPHMCNHKKTIYILEQKYGNNGYAFWFKLLEMLGSAEGHYLDLSDDTAWEFLQAKTQLDDSLCTEILTLLAKLDAIDAELWSAKVVWSQNFVDGISDVYRNRRVEIPPKPSFYIQKPDKEEVSTDEKPQSKVKESKVKETITTPISPPQTTPKFDPEELESRSRQLVEKFEKGFGRLLNEIEAAKVTAWAEEFDPELVEHALETAVLGNNRSCKYIGGILNNWHDKGVKCVQDAHDLERRFQDRKKNINQTNDRASPETKQFYVPPEVLSDLMNSG